MCEFYIGIIQSLIANVIFVIGIYGFYYYFIFSKYKGRFIHCNKDGKPFLNERSEKNYVDIKLSFWRPNVFKNKAMEYVPEKDNWKIWIGKISIDILSINHGIGAWKYEKQPYIGTHEIFIYDKNTYYVNIVFYAAKGKPQDLQIWRREGTEDKPLISN